MNSENLLGKISSVPKELWWRVLSYFMSAFIFVPNIALFMFLIYMAEYNFFSYDFFSDGIFGMKLFFFTTMFILIMASVIFFSPILLYVGKKKGREVDMTSFVFSIVSSIIIWLIFILKVIEAEDRSQIAFIMLICVFIAIHIGTLLFYRAKIQLASMVVISSLVIIFSLGNSASASKVVSIGLKAYGMGGDLPITITSSQNSLISKGSLKLITPNFIVFEPEGQKGVSTYSLSNISHYKVGN